MRCQVLHRRRRASDGPVGKSEARETAGQPEEPGLSGGASGPGGRTWRPDRGTARPPVGAAGSLSPGESGSQDWRLSESGISLSAAQADTFKYSCGL